MHGGEPATRCPATSAAATDGPTAGRTAEHRTSRSPFRGHVIDQKIWMLGITSECMGDETGRSQPSELTSRHTAMDGELRPKDEISIEDASQVVRDLINGRQAWIESKNNAPAAPAATPSARPVGTIWNEPASAGLSATDRPRESEPTQGPKLMRNRVMKPGSASQVRNTSPIFGRAGTELKRGPPPRTATDPVPMEGR